MSGDRSPRDRGTAAVDPAPPRLARWLVGRLVSAERSTEVHADLREIFTVEYRVFGARAARRRYWREVGGLLRWRQRRGAATPSPTSWIDGVAHDVRHGARALVRRPSFSAVAVLTLALGIWLSTAMFSLVYGVVLKPLALPDPESLVQVAQVSPDRTGPFNSGADFEDWRAALARADGGPTDGPFEELAAFQFWLPTVVTDQGARLAAGARVSPWFFRMIGVQPLHGRDFLVATDGEMERDAIILGHDLWQRAFGGDPEIIGKTVDVPPATRRVIGVLPPGLDLPAGMELWTTLDLSAAPWMRDRGTTPFWVFGRLAPGVSRAIAGDRLEQVAARLAEAFPETNEERGARVDPMKEYVVAGVRQPLQMLLGAVLMVLLIACTNVANLMLASGVAREREIGMYVALGATRGRVVRRMLIESAMLAGAGGAVGVFAAYVGMSGLRALVPGYVPRADEMGIDGAVLAFALGLVLVSALAAGMVPALRVARGRSTMASSSRGVGQSHGRTRATRWLLVAEFAASATLLVAAGLFLRSLANLQGAEVGMNVSEVSTLRVSLPTEPRVTAEALFEGLAALPGVRSAAATSHLPLTGQSLVVDASIRGGDAAGPRGPRLRFQFVSPNYFEHLGVPLLRGRGLTDADGPEAVPVALVNEAAERQYWPGNDVIGAQVSVHDQPERLGEDAGITVVGVVADYLHDGPGSEPSPTMFVPFRQGRDAWDWNANSIAFLLRGDVHPPASEREIRERVREVGAEIPVYALVDLESYRRSRTADTDFAARLLRLFSVLALVLAAVGIYGVVSFGVRRRTRDIGVRMALGAQRRQVIAEVLRDGMRTAVIGATIGLGIAAGLGRVIANLLHGVEPVDLVTYVGAAALLLASALVACAVPGRRASLVDPARALRAE